MSLNERQFNKSAVLVPNDTDRIGIMADSHGEAGLIAAAAKRLRAEGCKRLFHLGDICDTAHLESVAVCLQQVAVHRIAPIRGNNEHTLLLDRPASVGDEVLAAIAAMPLTRRMESAFLVHSLPYTDDLGARCMLEALTTHHIRAFFRCCTGALLFRGHSHQPEMVRLKQAAHRREAMTPAKPYVLARGASAVVTCGALIEGLSLIWDQRRRTVTSIPLDGGTA